VKSRSRRLNRQRSRCAEESGFPRFIQLINHQVSTSFKGFRHEKPSRWGQNLNQGCHVTPKGEDFARQFRGVIRHGCLLPCRLIE
jgi:hypothetical protein